MTAICTKTGCYAYSTEYGEFFYGDLYKHKETLLLRFNTRSHSPIEGKDMLHLLVREIGIMFTDKPYGMLVCAEQDADSFGYGGKPVGEALPGL